jgi:hypothetical protein
MVMRTMTRAGAASDIVIVIVVQYGVLGRIHVDSAAQIQMRGVVEAGCGKMTSE